MFSTRSNRCERAPGAVISGSVPPTAAIRERAVLHDSDRRVPDLVASCVGAHVSARFRHVADLIAVKLRHARMRAPAHRGAALLGNRPSALPQPGLAGMEVTEHGARNAEKFFGLCRITSFCTQSVRTFPKFYDPVFCFCNPLSNADPIKGSMPHFAYPTLRKRRKL
jgi:hypothetical protein